MLFLLGEVIDIGYLRTEVSQDKHQKGQTDWLLGLVSFLLCRETGNSGSISRYVVEDIGYLSVGQTIVFHYINF